LGKIIALEEQGFVQRLGKAIRETVSKIQSRGMNAFSKTAKSFESGINVALFQWHNLYGELGQELVKFVRHAVSMRDNMGLQQGSGRYSQIARGDKATANPFTLRLKQQ
jgi:hypothetical protein